MTEAPLAVEGLSVAFGRRTVLRDVGFRVPAGSLVGVIGPNGAGKSTLFKAILGIVPHTGTIRVDGRPAYVPQGEGSRLDLPVTALDVALMGRHSHAAWWRPLGRSHKAAARAALAEVGAEGLAGRQIGELSGGQRQRVHLARALAQGGRTLLLDEPLNGVDAPSERAILDVLRRRRDGGGVILMSTHDLGQAARVCDLLLFLNGSVTAYGPPDEAFTAETLTKTYGGELLVLGTGDGRGIGVLDDGSHHDHSHGGHGHGHDVGHDHSHPHDC